MIDRNHVLAEMAHKGIVPGETECCFLRRGNDSCTELATHAVINHRKDKDVVMPGCGFHAANLAAEDRRFEHISFARLDMEENL